MASAPQVSLHNCFRCGLEFQRFQRERVCPECRKEPHCDELLGKPLSLREHQIVDLIAEGLINKEIAFRLHLTPGTIKQYLNKVFAKLGTTNRVEVAVWSVKKRYGITD